MMGMRNAGHTDNPPSYIPSADPGHNGGGTYTAQSLEPTLEAYENIFGPSARDIKQDLQRFKRHGRWHLPDILKGPNQYLTDRVDGLITDATASPFTSRILPYKYITNVDGKIKWNVWSFDEGLSSRVPYESAARTLTQTKRSFNGYTIRQGMGIALEHNFLMSDAGRQNFKNQLNQLIGSIQLTNDLDVHVALVLAPSYQKTMQERYMGTDKTLTQLCREFVDMFGFVQKNQNALDILIEEAKGQLRTWGAPMPDFMLCNSKLTFQLTMTPDATNYATRGPEGVKRLKTGPDLQSYRGIDIIHTRAFSMETGAQPRDILRRRVRVAEYYRIPPSQDNHRRLFQLYNEERDTWSTFTFQELLDKAVCDKTHGTTTNHQLPGGDNTRLIRNAARMNAKETGGISGGQVQMLGTPFTATNGDDALVSNLSELFTQIIDRRLKPEFFWDVQFLSRNVVYVAGAMDNSLSDDTYKFTELEKFPVFMRRQLEAVTCGKNLESKNLARIQTQAVAMYPRDQLGFYDSMKIDNASDKLKFPELFMPIFITGDQPATGRTQINNHTRAKARYTAAMADNNPGEAADAVVDAAGGETHTAAAKRLQLKMATRNFNRYGVPVKALKKKWNESGTTKIEGVMDMAFDSEKDTHLYQNLRDLGAFQCPNHFKDEVDFTFSGDSIGYNMLMTQEFVQTLTLVHERVKPEDRCTYHGCFLFDIVTNPSKYDVLTEEVRGALADLKIGMDKGEILQRHTLGKDVIERVDKIIKSAAAKYDFTIDSDATDKIQYWLWPRTTSPDDEVFVKPTADGWKKKLHEFIPAFHDDLDITGKVLDQMCEKKVGFVGSKMTAQVACPRGKITKMDVIRFFNMLAWRLWADQEIGIDRVYPQCTGTWPTPSEYLFFNQYTSEHFGGAILMYAPTPPGGSGPPRPGVSSSVSSATKDIEVVIVRPNIEHYMMGIILGQGGESLGSTFWGQTELSCFDDSMHGIWGMSYKYNERAIVVNERNLVRLWDIAYDGYVGGKDDSAVDWNNDSEDNPLSYTVMGASTMDVTRPYRGASMMVMAFHHRDGMVRDRGEHFKEGYRSNWPSPIVFNDRMGAGGDILPADFDNVHAIPIEQFRVFNNSLYKNAYAGYKDKMPAFYELHKVRKTPGLAAVENEVSSDALAFQGTMRVLNADSGGVVQEVQGSGHHGPDFVGVASLRAGKGYKINSQPTMQRMV